MVHTGNHVINTIILGSGPPLVLLHGFGAGLAFWASNLKELAEHHKVYAMDLPGFGRSSRMPFKEGSAEDAEEYFIKSIEQWRREMQLETFSLLGHSFGGYLASAYALRYPQNIEHLILADPYVIKETIVLEIHVHCSSRL
jgi:pimeloyl-ACP methyl ester carboxylesterase